MTIINTREDLDFLKGTVEYDNFIEVLKFSIHRPIDTTIYPKNYNDIDYAGPKLEPTWATIEDLSSIEKFGFTKTDLGL
jgi:hypothetical protein